MLETLVPMKIPAFAAHLTHVEIMYSDNKNYELSAKWASERSFEHRKGSIDSTCRGHIETVLRL